MDDRRSDELKQLNDKVIKLETIVDIMDKDIRNHKGQTERQFEKLNERFEKIETKIDKLVDKIDLQLSGLSKQVTENRLGLAKIAGVASFCSVAIVVITKIVF